MKDSKLINNLLQTTNDEGVILHYQNLLYDLFKECINDNYKILKDKIDTNFIKYFIDILRVNALILIFIQKKDQDAIFFISELTKLQNENEGLFRMIVSKRKIDNKNAKTDLQKQALLESN